MELKIGVDLRCLPADGSSGAGVAHAARELTRALVRLGQEGVTWRLFVPSGAVWKDDVRRIELYSKHSRALRSALTVHPCDLLFVPSGAIALGLHIPTIPWVHDLAIYDHPEWFAESFLRRAITTRVFARGIHDAPHILTVSQSTKNDVVKKLHADPQKIYVTGEGGDSTLASFHGESLHEAKRRATAQLLERGMTHPYILFLGTLEPRKNIPMLLEAWLRARSRFDQPVDLVVVGRDGWKLRSIHHAIKMAGAHAATGSSRLHRIASASDEDRRTLLLAAQIVAVPSLHEGFGLVALEAMQAGTAVVASHTGALPEVLGATSALLPPKDSRLWSETLVHLMSNDDKRHRLAEQGKARGDGMTWEKVAKVVLDVLTKQTASRIVHP